MSEKKHTPGPWRVVLSGMIAGGNLEVARCNFGYDAKPFKDGAQRFLGSDEYCANAQLIAAAPELLEALEGLLDDFENYISDMDEDPVRAGYMEVSREVIKKAKAS